MWTLQPTDEYQRRHKRYEKKHRRELQAVSDNLDTFLQSLNEGAKPHPLRFGFLHAEPHGVVAIDQKGGGANLAQTRLYVFPDEHQEVLHVLTLGDKRTQSEDIKYCSSFVLALRAQTQEQKKDETGDQEDIQHREPDGA